MWLRKGVDRDSQVSEVLLLALLPLVLPLTVIGTCCLRGRIAEAVQHGKLWAQSCYC